MTVAVCFQCGSFKSAAFCPCPDCAALPQHEEELALSLAMTDHYFDQPALKDIATSIQAGNPPQLDEHTHAKMLEMLHGPEFMHDSFSSERFDERTSEQKPHLPRLDGADQIPTPTKAPWWKIW